MIILSDYQSDFSPSQMSRLRYIWSKSKMSDPNMNKHMQDNLQTGPALSVLDQIDPNLYSYTTAKNMAKPTLHIGQRKLFLCQLDFLNQFRTPGYVIYAGAAPSNTMWILSMMYPYHKFILIDPNPMQVYAGKFNHLMTRITLAEDHAAVGSDAASSDCIVMCGKDAGMPTPLSEQLPYIAESHNKLFVINDYFTIDMCRSLLPLKDVSDNPEFGFYFWSDIRTDSGNGVEPGDMHIVWNSLQQFSWVHLLRPTASMLKFRMPFYDVEGAPEHLRNLFENDAEVRLEYETAKQFGVDFLKNYIQHKFEYFSGMVRLQVWAGRSSTESRLIIENVPDIIPYDIKKYDDGFSGFNNIVRCFHIYDVDPAQVDAKTGFDRCQDCTREWDIIMEYCQNNPGSDPAGIRAELNRVVPRNMRADYHGNLNKIDHAYMVGYLRHMLKKLEYV